MEDKEFTPEEENNDGSKKKNKLWILIICFLAVILVIGGFSINSYRFWVIYCILYVSEYIS